MTATPVALFTYNRADHTARLLNSLENCARLNECSLHIYSDGPNRKEHADGVDATRRVVREHAARLGGIVIERDTNFGLARSIVDGVTDLCRRFGRVIVLEDDLVLSPSFIDYMLQALDRYGAESDVYQVSGYMFPIMQPQGTDAFFLPLITTWGWATWQRAWEIFAWDASDALKKLEDPVLRRRFDLNNSYPYSLMLENQLKGLTHSWGILFWWQVFKAGGVALHPRQSLVWNGGFDSTGTNCGDHSWSVGTDVDVVTHRSSMGTFEFPETVAIHQEAFNNICDFLRKEQYPPSLAGRIRRRLQTMLRA